MSKTLFNLYETVEASYLKSFSSSSHFALAISGGQDSMVLLNIFHHLSISHNFTLKVFHVNHGLMSSANMWAQMVLDQCQHYGIEVKVLRASSAKPKSNLEAWARKERYALSSRAMQGRGVLVLAHHLQDQAICTAAAWPRRM